MYRRALSLSTVAHIQWYHSRYIRSLETPQEIMLLFALPLSIGVLM